MNTFSGNICTKALAAVAAAGMAALTAQADLLYWMISDPVENWTTPGTPTSIAYTYATVKADGETLRAVDGEGALGGDSLVPDSGYSTGAAYFGLFDDTTTSFLVELWDDNETRVGWQTYRAADIADSIWKANTPAGSGASPLVVHDVVPEPTSGLLLMVGGALLALRRRRLA